MIFKLISAMTFIIKMCLSSWRRQHHFCNHVIHEIDCPILQESTNLLASSQNSINYQWLDINIRKLRSREKKKIQHDVFPCGHPPQYWRRPSKLSLQDQTGLRVFFEVWSYLIELLNCIIYTQLGPKFASLTTC